LNAIKEPVDLGQRSIGHICPGKREDDEHGRRDKTDTCEEKARPSRSQVPQVDGQFRGRGAGDQVRDAHQIHEAFLTDPVTRPHQLATASTSWRISSRVPSSRRSTCSSKSPEARGTSTCGSGTTMAPMRPSTPRRAACAFAEPDLPRTAPIIATGLLRKTLRPVGRDTQSIALASTPGKAPLYSGVAIRTAFEVAM